MKISPAQLRTVQTLFGLYARRSPDDVLSGDVRTARLAWASQKIERPIDSFTELHADEAARLIDVLKASVGQAVKPPWRRPRDRQAALAAGTHGRRNRVVNIEMLATPADLQQVDELRERAGMTRENFESWLASARSPIRGRASHELRTVGDCNKCRWALKAMLRRAG